MTESRCGLVCSECSYKEPFKCGGCANIENPFWGECHIKKCCEKDNCVEHCGNCNTFPCSNLTEFSNDPEHGDKGARIEQCRKWSKECGDKVE